MREVIHSVLAAEAEAKGVVLAARVAADRILSDAQKQSQDLIAQGHQKARAEAERIVAAAVKEAEQAKEKQLVRLSAEIEAEVQLDDSARRRAVAGAVRCVCGLH